MASQRQLGVERAAEGAVGASEAPREALFRAQLFGRFGLIGPDGIDATPPGRKARALLAYLLVTVDEAVTRERLAALLWSERSDEQARASLRQAFHEIRSLTGGDRPLIVLDRGQARLTRDRAMSDLDDILGRGVPGDGSLPPGLSGHRLPELLSDLSDIDPAFDDWLAGQRRRCGDALRGAVLAQAERVLATGDADRARRLAGLLLSTDPLDEAAARCAMRAAHLGGERDGVRLVHTRLLQALLAELGVPPAAETTELHQRLMSTPAPPPKAVAPAPALGLAPVPSPASASASASACSTAGIAHRRPWKDHRALAFAAAATVFVAVAADRFLVVRSGSAGALRVLAVEPLLVAAGDGPARALDHGLSTDLARMIVGNDAVLSVTDAPQGAPANRPPADVIVAGDVQSDGGMLHADIKLRRGGDRTAAILWSHSYTRPVAETDAFREQIATNVADVAVCALGGQNPSVEQLGTETMRLYLAACEQKHADPGEAKKLLTQVVARQPGFAHGWAMLAAATAMASDPRSDQADVLRRQADAAARRAIALDPSDGEAYFARAVALAGRDHWTERMAALRAGHAVDPTNAGINATLAVELSSVGRGREALAYAQRGWTFDPFSPVKASMFARLLGFAGDIDGANAILAVAGRRFPTSAYLARTDFLLAALVGNAQHAADLLAAPQRGFEVLPDRVARWRAVLDARLDPSTAKVDAAVKAVLDAGDEPTRRGTLLLAALVKLNRVELAFAAARSMTPAELADDTDLFFGAVMAPLRADPRFMAMAARAGLVSLWQQSGRWPDFCQDPGLTYDCRAEAQLATAPPAFASLPPGR